MNPLDKIFQKCYLQERKIFSSVWLYYENFSRKYFHVFGGLLKMLFSTTTTQNPPPHNKKTTKTQTPTPPQQQKKKKSEIKERK